MKALLALFTSVVLAGCAGVPIGETPSHLFADGHFGPPGRPTNADDLFVLDDRMRAFADTQVANEVKRSGVYFGLFDTLRAELRLDNAAPGTRPASETFALRTGNCLSLVVLTGAFAKHLGVPARYQAVNAHETWSRAGGIAFYSGHVNLKIGARDHMVPGIHGFDGVTIDFLAPEEAGRFSSRPLSEQTLTAMYLNNRGAEALVEGRIDEAYAWVREAIRTDPLYLAAVNTLGVVYLRHGDLREAERALEHVLRLEPANVNAITNLVHVLARAGRTEEADRWRKRLTVLAPYPPFYFLDEGLAALARGDAAAALELLERELRRMPYSDEVHFAMARAELELGELRLARKHLGLARKYSTTLDRRDLYGAKLARLKALEGD